MTGPDNIAGFSSADDDAIDLGGVSGPLAGLLHLAQARLSRSLLDGPAAERLKQVECTVLRVIAQNPGQRQGAIARALRIKPAHMTKLVQRLVAEGLVARAVPDADRRSVTLVLTAAGQATVGQKPEAHACHIARERGDLSEAEYGRLVALLRKYVGPDGADTP